MAYVIPSGIIQLFKNINLDNRYMHTIYFADANAQNNWFTSKVTAGLTFNNQSYSRPTRKTVKIHKNAEDLIGVTYMRFNNRGNKWYYAFVLSCDYINENNSLVTYEIDVMQTWFIQNGSIPACYVERQHVNNDTWTSHLEAEPIGSEVYDMTEIEVANSTFSSYDGIVQTSSDRAPGGEQDYGGVRDGIMTGGSFYRVQNGANFGDAMNNIVTNCLGAWDKNEQSADILDMYMYPHELMEQNHISLRVKVPTKFDNYTPINKKLFCYPFSQLYVTSNNGNNSFYNWEYFDTVTLGSEVEFDLYGCYVGGGSISLNPRMYNGIDHDYDDKIVIDNFPKISYSYDAYQAWVASGGDIKTNYDFSVAQSRGALAKEKNQFDAVYQISNEAMDMAKEGYDIYNSVSNGNMSGEEGVVNALYGGTKHAMAMVNSAQQMSFANRGVDITLDEAQHKRDFTFKDARYMPNKVVGKSSPCIAVAQKFLGFRFFNCHVRDSEAKRIDNFFSMYGYAVNNVTTPNLTGRSHWNFIKTKDCQIRGEMPASSKSAIGKIFDGGIFFWSNGDEVGNFGVALSGDVLVNT